MQITLTGNEIWHYHRGTVAKRSRNPVRIPRLSRPKIAHAVVARMKELIYQGVVQPGARLPSERDLAKQMGVGRPTVREAIHYLEGVGLVEIRPTVGIFVRSLTAESIETPLVRMLEDEFRVVMQFVETRIALEGWAAAEAARNATPEQIGRLERLTREMETLAEQGESLLPLDATFHQAILEATRNPAMLRMREILASLIASIRAFMNLVPWPHVGPGRAVHHRAITRAIAHRNPEQAHHAMVSHLRVLQETLAKVSLPSPQSPARRLTSTPVPTRTKRRAGSAPTRGSSR